MFFCPRECTRRPSCWSVFDCCWFESAARSARNRRWCNLLLAAAPPDVLRTSEQKPCAGRDAKMFRETQLKVLLVCQREGHGFRECGKTNFHVCFGKGPTSVGPPSRQKCVRALAPEVRFFGRNYEPTCFHWSHQSYFSYKIDFRSQPKDFSRSRLALIILSRPQMQACMSVCR
jgi:hypothetical protein